MRLIAKLIVSLTLCAGATAQTETQIEPVWVYVSPIHWVKAPRELHHKERAGIATIAVFYPEGQFAEVDTGVIEQSDKTVTFSHGDELLISYGTWARTDDRVIRISSKKIFKTPETVVSVVTPIPGPNETRTCALEGVSTANLAKTIHCKDLMLSPLRMNISLPDLRSLILGAWKDQQQLP